MTSPSELREKLKPCPFCGGSKVSTFPPTCKKNDAYNPADRAAPIVRCMSCYAEAAGKDWDASCNSAIAAWNRRLSDDAELRARLSAVEMERDSLHSLAYAAPAECGPGCEDPDCPYTHQPHTWRARAEQSESALSAMKRELEKAVKAVTDSIEQLDAILNDGLPTDFQAWRDDMAAVRSELLKEAGGNPETPANLVAKIPGS